MNYYISDLHFGCQNKYEGRTLDHDKLIKENWNKTVTNGDTVYILGDFSFASVDETRKILEKLNGKKHLIIGNHDGACKSLTNYFESTSQIKEVTFKKTVYPFLDEHMHCVLCHFPMVAWNRRMHGSVMLHGHTHGSLCEMNKISEELRLDIGLDGQLANGNLISLEQVYRFMKNEIAKGKTFQEHINYLTDKTGFRA